MWLGILSGLYAVPALLGLLASVWQTVSAVRRRRIGSAFAWLSLVALFLTGRWWVRLLRPAAADEPKPLRPDKCGTAIGRGGVKLEWEQFGPDDAPALLLTHGWSLSHETWYYQKKALSGEFRVIVWDLRGTDRSQAPADRDYSFDAMTADLAAVFVAANAGRHPNGCIFGRPLRRRNAAAAVCFGLPGTHGGRARDGAPRRHGFADAGDHARAARSFFDAGLVLGAAGPGDGVRARAV